MQSRHDFTETSDEDLALRRLELELELVSISEEQVSQKPRGVALDARDHHGKDIRVGDKVELVPSSTRGSKFDKVKEDIIVGWNNLRTDIII